MPALPSDPQFAAGATRGKHQQRSPLRPARRQHRRAGRRTGARTGRASSSPTCARASAARPSRWRRRRSQARRVCLSSCGCRPGMPTSSLTAAVSTDRWKPCARRAPPFSRLRSAADIADMATRLSPYQIATPRRPAICFTVRTVRSRTPRWCRVEDPSVGGTHRTYRGTRVRCELGRADGGEATGRHRTCTAHRSANSNIRRDQRRHRRTHRSTHARPLPRLPTTAQGQTTWTGVNDAARRHSGWSRGTHRQDFDLWIGDLPRST